MYNNLLSGKSEISASVLQESALGQLLILINVNEVAVNMLSMCRLFAGDNLFQYSSTNILTMNFIQVKFLKCKKHGPKHGFLN